MKKPSFLQRITGNNPEDHVLDDEYTFGDDERLTIEEEQYEASDWNHEDETTNIPVSGGEDTQQEGELPVDMFQTDDEIVVRAIVAGVSPSDLEISITRDMVTVRGSREEFNEARDDDYFHRELFWGGFSRTLLLPEEVMIDESEAKEQHGMLEIRMPKLDKHRTTQLRVKTGK